MTLQRALLLPHLYKHHGDRGPLALILGTAFSCAGVLNESWDVVEPEGMGHLHAVKKENAGSSSTDSAPEEADYLPIRLTLGQGCFERSKQGSPRTRAVSLVDGLPGCPVLYIWSFLPKQWV